MDFLRIELAQDGALRPRDHQNHRHRNRRAETLQHAEAIDIRHQQIEQNDGVAILLEKGQSLLAVRRFVDHQIAVSQNRSEQDSDGCFVVDDQHPL